MFLYLQSLLDPFYMLTKVILLVISSFFVLWLSMSNRNLNLLLKQCCFWLLQLMLIVHLLHGKSVLDDFWIINIMFWCSAVKHYVLTWYCKSGKPIFCVSQPFIKHKMWKIDGLLNVEILFWDISIVASKFLAALYNLLSWNFDLCYKNCINYLC